MVCERDRNGCIRAENGNGKPKNDLGKKPNVDSARVIQKPRTRKPKKVYRRKKARIKKVIITEHANKRRRDEKRTGGKLSCNELIHLAKGVKKNCQGRRTKITGIRTKGGETIDLVLKDIYVPREGFIVRHIITVI